MSLLEAISKARASGDPDLIALAEFVAQKLGPAEHRHRQRERLLKACAALPHFAGMSGTAVALEIAAGWGRYAVSAGDRERGHAASPPHRIGRPDEFYFQLHRLGFRPLGSRRLLDIL